MNITDITVELPNITIIPQTERELDCSLLTKFEEGLKEAKMMKEGKLPKKPLNELYSNN